MLLVLIVLPLLLNGSIALHVNMALAPLESVFLIYRYQMVEQQCIGTLCSVFRKNTYEQQVNDVGLVELQRTKQVPLSEGPQATIATFLQCSRERRNGYAHTNNVVTRSVPVFYDTKHVHREELEVFLHIFIYLLVGHL